MVAHAERHAPVIAAAVVAVLYVLIAPATADLATASFRADLFDREGFTVFSTAWYGGHHTPGYSVLYPPLGALLGVTVVGGLAAVGAAWAFGARAGRTAGLLAVPAIAASLFSGRMPYTLGMALGLAAVLAAVRERRVLAGIAAVLTALASPVAALFVGIAAAALVLSDERRRVAGLVIGVCAAIPTVVLVALFPEGGTFPFVVSAFLPCLLAAIAVAVGAPPGPVRTAAVLWGLLCVAAAVVPSPIGGNAVRLGTLTAIPLAYLFLWPERRRVLYLLAVPLAYWVLQPAARDVLRTLGDPSVEEAFYTPLVGWLEPRQPARVEIPFTQNHWETRWVAAHLPIARGWERQVDRDRNALFYEGELTPARYGAWLRENAIAFVALPLGIPFDASGEDEQQMVASGDLPYLREVDAGLRDWRVFAVEPSTPLASPPARLTAMGADGFTVRFDRPGSTIVRVHWTRYWDPSAGCVDEAPGDWTRIRRDSPGTTTVTALFALASVREVRDACDGG